MTLHSPRASVACNVAGFLVAAPYHAWLLVAIGAISYDQQEATAKETPIKAAKKVLVWKIAAVGILNMAASMVAATLGCACRPLRKQLARCAPDVRRLRAKTEPN